MNTIKISRTFLKTINVFVILMTIISQLGWGASKALADSKNPPVISEGDSVSVMMSENGSPTPFSLTLHAADPDGDTLTWSINTPAGYGTAYVSGTGDSKDISYTPEPDYLGSDSFVVQVSDGNEGTDTITVNVTINQTSGVLIDVTTNKVYGHNWPAWATVTISFNDPGDGTNWDYTTSVTAGPDGNFTVAIDPAEFQIQAGQVAHIEDMNGFYEFGIPDVRVTVVSALVGTIQGVAPVGAVVDVQPCYDISGFCAMRNAVANGSGIWMADFSTPGDGPVEGDTFDLLAGSGSFKITQYVNDAHTMGVEFGWDLGPKFTVYQSEQRLETQGWPYDSHLHLTIDYPGTPESPDVSRSQTVQNVPMGGTASFDNLGPIQPGYSVTLTDGTTTKALEVPVLTLTSVDQDTERFYGTANPNAWLEAEIGGNGHAYRVFRAEGDGNWMIDFSVPGGSPGQFSTGDIAPGTSGYVAAYDVDHDATRINVEVTNPNFSVRANNDQIEAYEWPLGATLNLKIDNPGTEKNPDYTETQIVGPDPWNPSKTYVYFNLWGVFDIQPGYLVSLSVGATTKTLTVSALAFTDFDIDADTVSGIADAGASVDVWACDSSNCYNRHATANTDGKWLANWHVMGTQDDEQNTFDLVRGTWVGSQQWDDDGDRTMFGQYIPNPYIEASLNGRWIQAREWALGTVLTLEIDDPGTVDDPDYTGTATVEHNPDNPDDPNDIRARFDWPDIGLQPGFIVTVSGDGTTKTLIIPALTVTAVDPAVDTVSGVATLGAQLHVCASIPNNCITRYVTADKATGLWTAYYRVAGVPPDDTATVDLLPGSNGWVYEADTDGDLTFVDWNVPNPNIFARLPENEVTGERWPLGVTVTLTIDDPDNGAGVDYTDTQTVGISDWDPNLTFIRFHLGEAFTLQPGQLVTMTDGATTKTHTVTNLAVTAIDPETDTVSGTAEPGSLVEVGHICDENGCAFRRVYADTNGNWTADFSVPGEDDDEQDLFNIRLGTGNEARQPDEDWDFTAVQWKVPNPYFTVKPNNEQVNAYEWPVGDVLTLKIYAPGVPDNPVSTTTSIVVGNTPWNSGQTYAFFDLAGVFDIQPEYTVSISNGTTTKTLTVSGLTFTHIDIENDLVEGVGNPIERVNVWACDWSGCYNRHVIADGDGNWSVDFTRPGSEGNEQVIFNIVNGTWIDSEQMDDDGDCTGFGMNVSLPYIEVSPGSHWVHARGNWPDGTITMNIDDPSNGAGIDYTVDATFGQNLGNPGDPNDRLADFDLDDFDLQAGQVISMSGGGISKTYTIQSLQVTGYDLNADTISGTGNSGHPLHVCINMPGYCVSRYVTVGGDGDWVADYHNPGARSDEQETVNLQDGSNGWVADYEDDGDQTWLDWNLIVLASASIGAEGGTLTTGNGDVSLSIPAGAVSEDLLFSITDQGGGYELAISDTTMSIVSSYTINPHGTTFDPPATVTFHWPDEDGDGIVDGTTLQESHLLLIKDGLIVTPACAVNPDCDMVANTLTVQVSSLSLFELAAPKDSDGDGLNDDLDACPNENPNGYDADHNGCTDTAVGLRQYLANLPANVVPSNIKTSLLAKVDSAIASLNRGKEQAAIGQLRAFINEVEAQRGKKITAATADLLIAYARNVMAKMP